MRHRAFALARIASTALTRPGQAVVVPKRSSSQSASRPVAASAIPRPRALEPERSRRPSRLAKLVTVAPEAVMAYSTKAAPRAPPGYGALAVESSQILLQLTISNKCGQAFRWRGVDVYEPYELEDHCIKLDRTASDLGAEAAIPLPRVKLEDAAEGSSSVRVKSEEDAYGDSLPIVQNESASETGKTPYRRSTEWSLCLADRVVFVRQDEERGYIYHRTLLGSNASLEVQAQSNARVEETTAAWLRDYLNLGVRLEAMYVDWSAKDPVFRRFATRFAGLRMLRQDPVECLFAFICSSNNNIARIGQMVQSLCTNYAKPIASITYPPPPPGFFEADDEVQPAPTTIVFHPFPDVSRLAHDDVEANLRKLMFGYRAKFIQDTARRLLEIVESSQAGAYDGEEDIKEKHVLAERRFDGVSAYLHSLRDMTYPDARQQLLQFTGVGPKVADCILLMSMDQPSSIPVDRHVFQFAEKWYKIRTKGGHKGYEHIAETFRTLWGPYAGWAHSVLFTADLRAFQTYKVEAKEEVKEEMGLSALVKEELSVEAPGVLPGASQYTPAVVMVASAGFNDSHDTMDSSQDSSPSARDVRRQRRLERVEDLSRTLGQDTSGITQPKRPVAGRKRSLLKGARPEDGGIKGEFSPRKVQRGPLRTSNGDVDAKGA